MGKSIAKWFYYIRPEREKLSERIFLFAFYKFYIMFFSHKSFEQKLFAFPLLLFPMTNFHVQSKRNLMKTENCIIPPQREEKKKMKELPPKGEETCTFKFSDVNRNIVSMASPEC
jgi:hypothetical protein